MAKTRMICPFSGELCKECAFYRGRHYYLCFCKKYRGYLSEPGKAPPTSLTGSNKKFEMPSINPRGAIDPFTKIMKDMRKER